jgi:hypothetical protein
VTVDPNENPPVVAGGGAELPKGTAAGVAPNTGAAGTGAAGVEPNIGAADAGACGVEPNPGATGAKVALLLNENPDCGADVEACSLETPNRDAAVGGGGAGADADVEPNEKPPDAGTTSSLKGCEPKAAGAADAAADVLPKEKAGVPVTAAGAGAPNNKAGVEELPLSPPRCRLLRSSSAESAVLAFPRGGAEPANLSVGGVGALLPK